MRVDPTRSRLRLRLRSPLRRRSHGWQRSHAGFTLVELLVAISIMALMALMSWRGLDGMARTQTALKERADQVAALQTGLLQWQADLDAIQQTPRTVALDWNGRALRITRRGTQGPGDGLRVVAWSRRAEADGANWWLRWESPPVTTRGEWRQAWAEADTWAQNPGIDARRREVAIAPMLDWQIVYYRNNTWTNPLSSDAGAALASRANTGILVSGLPAPLAGSTAGAVAAALAVVAVPTLPDGVRLVLTLPAGRAVAGTLVRDWVNPAVGGGKT